METYLPQITTIIPTYRRPKLLRRAIQSVLNQTYPHFEVRIYDNASGDETAEVVAEFAKKDPRIKYYCHSSNIGATANFNFGLKRVGTPYFSFLSDDDVLLPNFYETTLAGFAKHPGAIFSAGEVIEMTISGEVLKAPLHSWSREGYFTPPEGLIEMIRIKPPILTGVLLSRKVVEEFGEFDLDLDINDYNLELQLAARFPFVVSRELCAIFVLQPSSLSVSAGTSFLYKGYPKTLANLKNNVLIAPDVRKEGADLLEAYLKRLTFRSGLFLLSTQDYNEVRKIAKLLYNTYDLVNRAFILESLVWLFQKVKTLPKILATVYGFRKARAEKRRLPLQTKFGYAIRYMTTEG
jgi:glycosyltransferase involved in cell wall biosynthesis